MSGSGVRRRHSLWEEKMRERCRDPVVNEDQTFTVVFGAEEEKLAEGGVWVGTYAEGGWVVR